jgi:hypothetical protein
MEGVIASDDKVRVLPSVRTARGDEAATEKEVEKGRKEHVPEELAVRPVSSSTPVSMRHALWSLRGVHAAAG